MLNLSIIATAALALMVGPPAWGQSTPLTNGDVIGSWTLVITPAERQGIEINVEMDADDLPLTVEGRPTGRLTCTLRGDPADCRIRNGELVVVMPTRSGGARMIFTITDRTRAGLGGAARVSVRFLPIGGHIGAVAMTRR
jgi:hypothetical protein